MLSDIGGSNHQMQLSAPCFDEVREKSDSVCYFVVIFFDKTSVTFLLAIWYYALSGNYVIFKSYIKLKLLYVYLPRKRIVILCYMYITHLFICCSQEHSIVYIHSFFHWTCPLWQNICRMKFKIIHILCDIAYYHKCVFLCVNYVHDPASQTTINILIYDQGSLSTTWFSNSCLI